MLGDNYENRFQAHYCQIGFDTHVICVTSECLHREIRIADIRAPCSIQHFGLSPTILCTLTDCQPVLFADLDAGVIGAAHTGWNGALHGVPEATVNAMESVGATREQVT